VGGAPFGNLAEMSERIFAAAEQTGIGMTMLPVLYQFGGCDRRALNGGQRRFGNDPERFMTLLAEVAALVARAPADTALGVAPHSLRAVDPAGLRRIVEQATSGPIHMHLAEQVAEVDEVLEHLGARPTEWLLANHAVDDRWCLIHCTQMTEAETTALAASGATAGLCPITESSLGDGIFNGTTYLGVGGTIGFGSDSNIQISLFEELKTLEYSQRLRDRSRAALATQDRSTGRVLFDAALRGGAQAGGRDSGRIETGALADLVGLDDDNQWLCNRKGDAALDSLIFGGGGQACIRDVWSAGRHVVKEGRHVSRERIITAFKRTMNQLEADF
jgi:formimidoylglutamate deiminase